MLTIWKRGRTYHLRGRIGGRRVRASLGTHSRDSAVLLTNTIDRAIAQGKESEYWPHLSNAIRPAAFRELSAIVGYVEKPQPEPLTWNQLLTLFDTYTLRQVARRKLRETTRARYRQTIKAFSAFLAEAGISRFDEIKRSTMEDFKAWRLRLILSKKQARGGTGIDLDIAILHRVFAYALDQYEISMRNPVKMEGTPGKRPGGGAQPFSAEELAKLRVSAGEDLLSFLLLRHSGMRGGDVVDLRWREVDWTGRGINRLTQKREKRIWVPLHPELLFALEAERQRRQPQQDENVLLSPTTSKPLKRPKLYERVRALGRRAGVVNAHPHRFRDTFAVDLLLKGASPYDVAKLLGDTVLTVEEHYAPFVRELRERARRFVESGHGLEETMDTKWTQSSDRKTVTQ